MLPTPPVAPVIAVVQGKTTSPLTPRGAQTRPRPALGPTVEGFDHLQRYLAEFGRVFDHYSSMFVEWANVNSPKAPLRPKLARYVDYHAEHMGASLRDSGYEGDETVAASFGIRAVERHVEGPHLDLRRAKGLRVSGAFFSGVSARRI